MGRKLLALLTAFAILTSICTIASAAKKDSTRRTQFFTDQPHADIDFSEMKYKRIEPQAVLAEMDELRKLLHDSANTETVEESFNAITSRYLEVLDMYTLTEIKTYQNASDEKAAENMQAAYDACLTVADALPLLVQDILKSPCAGFLTAQLSEEDAAYYLAYQPASPKQFSQASREAALENEYLQAAAQSGTAEYFGREWDFASITAAYGNGEIDAATFAEIYGMLAREQNETLGKIYLQLVSLRKNAAQSRGCDSYMEYAYESLYGRDYSPQEVQSFREDVKTSIVPLCTALRALSDADEENNSSELDYSGDAALDMIEPYIGQMSDELLEAFTYMREHALYDSEKSENKIDAGFTATLYSYGAPFTFNAPMGGLYDFTTAVHEFGHYNNAYWQSAGWNDSAKSQDVLEVHSQGLELLLSHYYPEIFGKDADVVQNYLLLSLTSAICEGAYYDELQQFIYDAKNVTLSQINEKASQLSIEYGFAEADSPMADVYGLSWVQVSHNFTSPFYYISYAVSAAGAFAFWLDAQQDYFSAVDSYLAFTALDASYGLQDSFEAVGLASPLSPGYLPELAASLRSRLNIDARMAVNSAKTSFPDVPTDSWYAPYVLQLADAGCVEGYEDGAFHPGEAATWGTAMRALFALTGQRPEIEDGEPITRADFCRLIVEILDIPAATDSSALLFTDIQDAAVTALAEAGVVSGYEDGTFRPDGTLTRAELCVILCRAAALRETVEARLDTSPTADTSIGSPSGGKLYHQLKPQTGVVTKKPTKNKCQALESVWHLLYTRVGILRW